MRAHFEREAEAESSWTTYNPSLGRTLLNTEKFLRKEQATAAAAAASAGDGDTLKASASSLVAESSSNADGNGVPAGIPSSLPLTDK
jgi:hypothetical protein